MSRHAEEHWLRLQADEAIKLALTGDDAWMVDAHHGVIEDIRLLPPNLALYQLAAQRTAHLAEAARSLVRAELLHRELTRHTPCPDDPPIPRRQRQGGESDLQLAPWIARSTDFPSQFLEVQQPMKKNNWKHLRETVGLGLRQAAGEIGVSPTFLHQIESGTSKCPAQLAVRLSALYKCEVVLFRWETPTYDLRESLDCRVVASNGRLDIEFFDDDENEWTIDGDVGPYIANGFVLALTKRETIGK